MSTSKEQKKVHNTEREDIMKVIVTINRQEEKDYKDIKTFAFCTSGLCANLLLLIYNDESREKVFNVTSIICENE